jgi:hypothetical protein
MSCVVAPLLMSHTCLLMVCAYIRFGTCVRASVESPHLKSVLNFENFKYTNYSRILITLNHLEAKFNVPLSCQSHVLIVFVTRFPGCKRHPVDVVFFMSGGV